MTKYSFLYETHKIAKRATEHDIVQRKITETLSNMGEHGDSLLAMAMNDVATRAAAVSRAMVLNREPGLLDGSFEPSSDEPWHNWDPVVIFVSKPDWFIKALENAVNAIDDGFSDEDDKFSIQVLEKLVSTIKEQI